MNSLKITPESTKTLYCPPMQFANMLPDSLLSPVYCDSRVSIMQGNVNKIVIYHNDKRKHSR